MITIQKFVTSDGREFMDKNEAKEHECIIDAAKQLNNILQSSLSTCRPEAILMHILLEVDTISDVFKAYKKSKPKQRSIIA